MASCLETESGLYGRLSQLNLGARPSSKGPALGIAVSPGVLWATYVLFAPCVGVSPARFVFLRIPAFGLFVCRLRFAVSALGLLRGRPLFVDAGIGAWMSWSVTSRAISTSNSGPSVRGGVGDAAAPGRLPGT